MSRPVVGVTCCNRPFGGETAQVVIDRYVRALMRWAGVSALLVPAMPDLLDLNDVAGRLDGLLLTGSPSNIEAARYGDPASDAAGPFDPGRDAVALGLIQTLAGAGKPILAVCRGFQEINVAFGGTLDRSVGDRPGLAHHAPADADLEAMFAHGHAVDLVPGGLLAGALGGPRLTVNSVHFQGIGRLGAELVVEARAPDGLIEAFRGASAPIVAVQWHPEWRTQEDAASQRLFALFGAVLRGETPWPPVPRPPG